MQNLQREAHFNLVDEPWIPVAYIDGKLEIGRASCRERV